MSRFLQPQSVPKHQMRYREEGGVKADIFDEIFGFGQKMFEDKKSQDKSCMKSLTFRKKGVAQVFSKQTGYHRSLSSLEGLVCQRSSSVSTC